MSEFHFHSGMDGEQVIRHTPGQSSQAPADISRVTVGNIQGVTSWSASQRDESAPQAPTRQTSDNRVHTGHLSYINGVQQGPEATVTRQTSEDLAPASLGGILGTVRNNAGFPTGSITPNCTVELPGMGRTSVKVAANLGFLTLTADGRYVEAGASGNAEGGLSAQAQAQAANNTPQAQEQQGEEGPALFSSLSTTDGSDLEAFYGGLIEPFQQSTYDAMLATATAHLAQDGDAWGLITSLADRFGGDLAAEHGAFYGEDTGVEANVRERVEKTIMRGWGIWQRQVDEHVEAAGIVPEDFYQWARESNPEALKQAIQGQLFGRSLKGYSDLMESYFDNVPPTLEALQRGGIPTKEQGGTTFVQLGGTWMSLQAAAKARMV